MLFYVTNEEQEDQKVFARCCRLGCKYRSLLPTFHSTIYLVVSLCSDTMLGPTWLDILWSISKELPDPMGSWGLALYSNKVSGCPWQMQWSPLPVIPKVWTNGHQQQNKAGGKGPCLNKLSVVCSCNGILVSHKKDCSSEIHYAWIKLKTLCKVK